MSEHPAEIPAEAEGGGGRIDWSRLRGGIGGPNELPPPDWVRRSFSQLVNEVFRLRDRIHTLESHILAAKIHGGALSLSGRIGLPNELPEGEGGGGGGGIHEIHEIHEIAELPIGPFVNELAGLVARFSQFEQQVTQQLGAITTQLAELKR